MLPTSQTILLGLFLLTILAACNQMGDKPADGFLIEGVIEKPIVGSVVALYRLTAENPVVDSVTVDDEGKFRFVGKVTGLQMFRLDVSKKATDFFVCGNEEVKVSVKGASTGYTVAIDAGEENKKLKPVLSAFKKQSTEFGPMEYEYGLAMQNRDIERATRYREMLEKGSVYYKNRFKFLIDSLGPSFGAYTAASGLNMEEDFGVLDTLSQNLIAKYKDQKWATDFAKQVDDVRNLTPGQTAPAFSLATPEGKMLRPTDFKGQFLVLDFWASWCKPCRINSPAMVALYKKYHGKKVEFLGVSLDAKKERWEKAILEDGYTWPQVSDLKEWESVVVPLYRLEGIPNLVLLDKEGKIVARDLTPEMLDTLLSGMVGAM